MDEVADATVAVLLRSVPVALLGIAFLSGEPERRAGVCPPQRDEPPPQGARAHGARAVIRARDPRSVTHAGHLVRRPCQGAGGAMRAAPPRCLQPRRAARPVHGGGGNGEWKWRVEMASGNGALSGRSSAQAVSSSRVAVRRPVCEIAVQRHWHRRMASAPLAGPTLARYPARPAYTCRTSSLASSASRKASTSSSCSALKLAGSTGFLGR